MHMNVGFGDFAMGMYRQVRCYQVCQGFSQSYGNLQLTLFSPTCSHKLRLRKVLHLQHDHQVRASKNLRGHPRFSAGVTIIPVLSRRGLGIARSYALLATSCFHTSAISVLHLKLCPCTVHRFRAIACEVPMRGNVHVLVPSCHSNSRICIPDSDIICEEITRCCQEAC